MLNSRVKYPYHVPIPDCPHNIKSVRSSEFWHWIDITGFLINVRLLLLLRRESDEMKNSITLKALCNKDRMDVETAVEIHRQNVQDNITENLLATALIPKLEFKNWKRNGSGTLEYPVGIVFLLKYSKLSVTDHLCHAVLMANVHCPVNVSLIAGVKPGYSNGHGRKAKFRNPAGIVATEDLLYICDQENSKIRVVNIRSLFCHASQIPSNEDHSDNNDEDCAMRRVRQVQIEDLVLTSENYVPGLQSPFALCASKTPELSVFVSDVNLHKVFRI